MQARRALVKLLLTVAAAYSVVVRLHRDSQDSEVLAAFKKVIRKAHPDKGGADEHAKQLNAAKERWDQAKKPRGRPKRAEQPEAPAGAAAADGAPSDAFQDLIVREVIKKAYRIQSAGVLLTYFGVQGLPQWRQFLAHVRSNQKAWKVRYWCATLERTKTGRLHVHLMLQFTQPVDRTSRSFAFKGWTGPRADANDLLGGGFCRKRLQDSLNRGMFYCWADKLGTVRDEAGRQCTDGNYEPAWTDAAFTYTVRSRWAQDLWQAYKLSHGTYDGYLYKTRDGVLAKKRNLDACREREARDKQAAEIEARTKRLRGNKDLFPGFPTVPAAVAWLEHFKVRGGAQTRQCHCRRPSAGSCGAFRGVFSATVEGAGGVGSVRRLRWRAHRWTMYGTQCCWSSASRTRGRRNGPRACSRTRWW